MAQQKQADLSQSERIGEFRLKIIGCLLASPPVQGDLKNQLSNLASKPWLHPISGDSIHYSIPTLERWYYKSKNTEQTSLQTLNRGIRNDKGCFKSLTNNVCQALKQQYEAHDGWSVQLHYDNLLVTIDQEKLTTSIPSYSSISRYMKARHMPRKSKRKGPNSPGAKKAAKRLEQREVRSYEIDYVNGLWHLDFHHGSLKVINSKGEWVKPLLLAILDDHSRLICHMQWYYGEDTQCLVHGFCQALQKRALPRSLLTDNGSAMISGEFTRGLVELGIVHHKTLPYSPYQNGKQETFWANVEGRLLAMLEHQENLTLRQLNQITQAWVEGDYHQKNNQALGGQTPINHYLNGKDVGRVCPDSLTLKKAFRKKAKRKQRHSDGTISLDGKRYEVPNAYYSLSYISVRYASWDYLNMDMIDPDTNAILTALYPQDKSANADGLRRVKHQEPQEQKLPFSKKSPYLEKLIAEYAATGLPQNYSPKDEIGEPE